LPERARVLVVEQLAQAAAHLRHVGRLVEGIEQAAARGHLADQAERAAGRVACRVGLEHHVGSLGPQRRCLDLRLHAAVRREQKLEDVLGELVEGRRHDARHCARRAAREQRQNQRRRVADRWRRVAAGVAAGGDQPFAGEPSGGG